MPRVDRQWVVPNATSCQSSPILIQLFFFFLVYDALNEYQGNGYRELCQFKKNEKLPDTQTACNYGGTYSLNEHAPYKRGVAMATIFVRSQDDFCSTITTQ